MSSDSYISDYKLNEIRKEYGEKIASFSRVKQQIEEWYTYFDFEYPASSINNYRDSWFHYRKIWMERSWYEITCQMATFDEHLQRAEKDAVVNFFQTVSEKLEYWYHVDKKNIPEDFLGFAQETAKKFYDIRDKEELEDRLWVHSLWECCERDEQKASFSLLHAAKTYILNSEKEQRQLQKLLHLIKNTTLKIRLGASDVQRIEFPGEYFRSYSACYNEVYDFFQQKERQELFFLLGLTDVVRINEENYEFEKKSAIIATM